jgi:hypothetical protein
MMRHPGAWTNPSTSWAAVPRCTTPSEYREFDGIMVPTRRRAYVRNHDGSPVRDSVSIAGDVTDVTFS